MHNNLRWISWYQQGDADHEPDCRPVAWPPPPEVLAFWETGVGGDEGADAFCTIVRKPSSDPRGHQGLASGGSTTTTDRRYRRTIVSLCPSGLSSWGAGLGNRHDGNIRDR